MSGVVWAIADNKGLKLRVPTESQYGCASPGTLWNIDELKQDYFRIYHTSFTAKEHDMSNVHVSISTTENGYMVEQAANFEGRGCPEKTLYVFETFDGLTAHLRKIFNVDAPAPTPVKRK